MANHKSAKKRHRQSLIKRERNRFAKSTVRTAFKEALAAISSTDPATKEKAPELMRIAERTMAKATSKGIIHKNTLARKVSRLRKAASK